MGKDAYMDAVTETGKVKVKANMYNHVNIHEPIAEEYNRFEDDKGCGCVVGYGCESGYGHGNGYGCEDGSVYGWGSGNGIGYGNGYGCGCGDLDGKGKGRG